MMKTKNIIDKFTLYLPVMVLLIITPSYTFDPINIPKMATLVTYGATGLIYIIINYHYFQKKLTPFSKLFVTFFSLTVLISFLSSDAPSVQQIYGREGRNNGLLIYLTLLIIFILNSELNLAQYKKNFVQIFSITTFVIITYGIFQSYGLDPFKWQTVNRKVFSTFGNPNFLSAYLALSLIPTIIFIHYLKYSNKYFFKHILVILATFLNLYLQSNTNSYQGFVITIALLFLWSGIWAVSKNKKVVAISSFVMIGFSFSVLILVIAKIGFFGRFYKGSFGSRIDFFYSAYHMGKANWMSGVGIDSFGDYYLKYRSFTAANKPNSEYTDSAHNYFLDIFGNLGFFSFLIYLVFTILTLYFFIIIIKKNQYDPWVICLFMIWVGCQLQSLLSPTNLVFNVLIFSLAGVVFGESRYLRPKNDLLKHSLPVLVLPSLLIGLTISALLLSPLVKRDRAILLANNKQSADQLAIALDMFPKSTTGYQRSLLLFDNSGLSNLSYSVAKNASSFNPRSSAPWYIIFISPVSSQTEKDLAYRNLVLLDPNNMYVKKLRN